jgi:hemerythrin
MAFIDWTDKYTVGIKEIDAQHQRLVSMINTLHDAMKGGKGKDVVQPILNDLLAYTKTHFAHEEELFKQHGYPSRDGHEKIHKSLAQQVVDLRGKVDGGSKILAVELMDFMKTWLTSHIMSEDKKYAPFLNSKGVV